MWNEFETIGTFLCHTRNLTFIYIINIDKTSSNALQILIQDKSIVITLLQMPLSNGFGNI